MPLAENAPSGVCLNQWALYYADYSKFWFDRPHREQQHETTTAMNISECLIRLAEMQAEFGDTEVALETCIDAARETHLLRDGESDFSYLEQLSVRMQALVARSTHPSAFEPTHSNWIIIGFAPGPIGLCVWPFWPCGPETWFADVVWGRRSPAFRSGRPACQSRTLAGRLGAL